MRLTTKGRFAVTAMIDLALRQNTGPVTLAAISQRQQISLSYLEQLFGKLRRHDLDPLFERAKSGAATGEARGALSARDQALQMFKLGLLSLEQAVHRNSIVRKIQGAPESSE